MARFFFPIVLVVTTASGASASVCYNPPSSCTTGTEISVGLVGASDVTSGTGQAGTTIVDFVSTTALDLAGGSATIKPDTGKSFDDLTITTPGFSFTDFEYSAAMFNNTTATTLDFTVSAYDGATLLGANTYIGLAHDQNVTYLLTSMSPITKIVLSSTSGFSQLKQFDLSGIAVSPSPSAPLPAALPLFATGLGALGALGVFGWRKRRKAIPAT